MTFFSPITEELVKQEPGTYLITSASTLIFRKGDEGSWIRIIDNQIVDDQVPSSTLGFALRVGITWALS